MTKTTSPMTYADRPWVKNFDVGIPETLSYPAVPLYHFLQEIAKKRPQSPALLTTAKLPLLGRQTHAFTYGELDQTSDAFAASLIANGLKKGDRVAIIMPNCTAFAIVFYGILKAGGVVAANNPTYPPDKMAHQLMDSGAEIAVTLSLFYKTIKEIQPQTRLKKVIVSNIKEYLPPLAKVLFTLAKEKKEGHFVESLAAGDAWLQDILKQFRGHHPHVDVKPDDLALFQYTGGTTGVAKAAVAQHKALVANMVQMDAFLKILGIPGEKHIYLGAIPMFHVYGLVVLLSSSVYQGSQIVLIPNARDINEVVECIGYYKPTLFPGVPALYNAINNHPRILNGEISLKSLKFCFSGSAPLPSATKQEFERLSGSSLREGFGMSEAPTATHANPITREPRQGSIGLPLPDMDMRIVSLDDGVTDVPVGEIGELIVTGPNLMMGYHQMPTETANTLRESGGKHWLYTGDIARMDEDGYFYIVDRKKDMALIGGFNVYPTVVEDVIKSHPAVLEVGVAAVPHPEKEGQEALKAWIVLKPGAQATEKEIIAHCAAKLAPYEVPRRISFIAELPKTAIGKTLRRELIRLETNQK
jgi:long-chain acyl-CoA synthetase